MYKDNSLIPSEAVRLAALGLLAKRPRVYADLARDIRHFTARIVGPSLDLLGPSLELLKIEGLIEAVDPKLPNDAQTVRLAKDGVAELQRLMNAHLRGPMGEVNKLIVALKLYFLDLPDARAAPPAARDADGSVRPRADPPQRPARSPHRHRQRPACPGSITRSTRCSAAATGS